MLYTYGRSGTSSRPNKDRKVSYYPLNKALAGSACRTRFIRILYKGLVILKSTVVAVVASIKATY